MATLEGLKYTKSHEWVKENEDGTVTVGLTDYAQQELGDLVFVNLPEVDDTVTAGEALGDVESVKAVSDIFCPVSGTVCEVNEELLAAAYEAHCQAEISQGLLLRRLLPCAATGNGEPSVSVLP